MSSLKTLQDELREVSQKKTVRIKRGLSEDVSVAPSFAAARNYFKSPMQSLNKTLFPSNARENPTRFPPAVQILLDIKKPGLLFQLWCRAHFPTV